MTKRKEQKQPEMQTILDGAKSIVYGDRNRTYGHPTTNFDNIAELWNAYLSIVEKRNIQNTRHTIWSNLQPGSGKINNLDVANLNILQKIARLGMNQTHMDSILDIAGYAATQERIIKNV